jgi:hypothetical protein
MTEIKKKIARTRITVSEGERALVLINGKFDVILGPGRHVIGSMFSTVKVEAFQLSAGAFASTYEQALMASRPDLVSEHFTDVRTAADEVGVIYRDGKLHSVQKPDARQLFWTDAGPWKVELIDAAKSLEVQEKLAQRLAALSPLDRVKRFSVEDGQAGLLYVDGAFVRLIKPGVHAFWSVGRTVNVKIVDTRQHALDVTGQEVLTRDKVSLRVNLVAKYTVVDVVKAVSSVKDYADALYRALQHAFRQSLSAKWPPLVLM